MHRYGSCSSSASSVGKTVLHPRQIQPAPKRRSWLVFMLMNLVFGGSFWGSLNACLLSVKMLRV